MLFSCLVLFLFNRAFAEISKSRPNGKSDSDSKSSLKFDNNQKAKPTQHLREEEARKVQPNIILVLVSRKWESSFYFKNIRISDNHHVLSLRWMM